MARQERTQFPKELHTRLFGKQTCLQATQSGPQSSSPWFSPVPTHLSKIKSRESGCQTAAVEGDSATAPKQRLPRGAGRRGAGDPNGAAVSQRSSPSPKREAHAQPQRGGLLMTQRAKRLPSMRETPVRSLDREDPLEKGMATHSSILSWRIPWTEETGKLQSTGSHRVGHD